MKKQKQDVSEVTKQSMATNGFEEQVSCCYHVSGFLLSRGSLVKEVTCIILCGILSQSWFPFTSLPSPVSSSHARLCRLVWEVVQYFLPPNAVSFIHTQEEARHVNRGMSYEVCWTNCCFPLSCSCQLTRKIHCIPSKISLHDVYFSRRKNGGNSVVMSSFYLWYYIRHLSLLHPLLLNLFIWSTRDTLLN